MRVKRHKKEITFFGWVLVSSLLLVAATRADDPTYSGRTVGPLPANSGNAQEILRRARGTLPADQYDAFEKAMKRIETGNTGPAQPAGPNAPNRAGVPGEPVIDGAGIPSTITFDRQGPQQPEPPQPVQQPPVATRQPAEPDRAPAEAPLPGPAPTQAKPAAPAPAPAKPEAKSAKPTQFYDPSLPSPDPVK